MKQETIRLTSDRAAAHCAERTLNDTPHDGRYVVEIKEHVRNRTEGQNSRYWATLTEEQRKLNEAIQAIVKRTGHTDIEIRRIVAGELPTEQAMLLYVNSPEIAHELLKTINGLPTSTRLGTKQFITPLALPSSGYLPITC